jgi:phenylpropionate dioxygenase-like ring-hydroxylating dioxygenase large terminal subunit
MGSLDHWHPIRQSNEVGKKPVAAQIDGQEIVLFRGEDGAVGALVDRCPHRRMRLSTGWVEGNQVVCPYHGFSYDRDGAGKSPASPKQRICAQAFDVIERHDAIWVKRKGAEAQFPTFHLPGFVQIAAIRHRFEAPLELVVDNFSELEHACTTHLILAQDREGVRNSEVKVESTEDTVRVLHSGPQRKLPAFLEKLLQFRSDDLYVGSATFRFSPIHAQLATQWVNPKTGESRTQGLAGAAFFTPVDDKSTDVMIFYCLGEELQRYRGLMRLLTRTVLTYEVILDRRMVAALADKSPSLRGMSLGRFDRALPITRDRIRRIYYGERDQTSPVEAAPAEAIAAE